MKIFGLSQRLFEEPIGDLGGGDGGDLSGVPSTALATVPGESAPSGDAPASGEPGTAVQKFSGHIFTEDNKINPAARPIMESLRRDHPVFENRLRGVIHESRQLRSEFGGLQEVRDRIASLQQIIDDFGGEDQLSEARGELEFFHNLDQQFTAGDPRFIKAMIDAPGGQEAFLKLAPSMMAEYERMHPEGFANFVDNKLVNRMRDADFRVNLERLADFLVQLPEGAVRDNAATYWVAIRDFYNKLTASAQNKPVAPAVTTPVAQPDNRGSDLDNRELALKKREFATAGSGEINAEFARQWSVAMKAYAKGSGAIQSHIRPAFDMKMKAALQADKSVDKAIQGYFSRGDVEGYRAYMRTQYAKNAPRILKGELGHYRTGAAPAPPDPTVAAPVSGAPVATRTEAGWTILNRKFTSQELGQIDYDKTNRVDFLNSGKATMKDGRRLISKR